MAIRHTCTACHAEMNAPDHCAGRRIRCPSCFAVSTLPTAPPNESEEVVVAEVVPDPATSPTKKNPWDIRFLEGMHGPRKVQEFLEPPMSAPQTGSKDHEQKAARADAGDWVKKMFAALLDPRSIQWLLTLGGGLMVLGGLIWLISWGAFENPWVAALILGVASLGVLALGWFVVLKTRYRIAGRALTFLGCVFVSLNLWFYHGQGLLLLDQGLWMAGVVCVLLYVATVWVLRDPLFMYAVQAGVTLTAVLLLGDLGLAGHATPLSILLMTLALISIHAPKAFPAKAGTFTEERFGLPLFWCGHGQLAAALGVLLGSQIAGWIGSIADFWELPADGILLTNSRWAPGLLWLAGAYAYLYSDLAVRRVGVYMYLAAVSLVMAEASLIGFDLLGVEGLIATLAMTATAISLVSVSLPETEARFARTVPPLALVLSILPAMLGLALHVRSTSVFAAELGLRHETTWLFVGVMLVVALANRVSAFVYRQRSPSLAAVYLFFTAGALVVAAAGLLRVLDQAAWYDQTPWLMLIPIGYMVAARLWRGQSPERPVAWVAHTTTVIILAHVLFGSMAMLSRGFEPVVHLSLALVLAETALFYALARMFRDQPVNTCLAVAAVCAATWQFMLYLNLPQELFTIVFAMVGLALLVAARWLGLHGTKLYSALGAEKTVTEGQGAAALYSGHAVLSMALLVAFMKGLAQLAAVGLEHRALTNFDWLSLGLMTLAAIAGAAISQRGDWRRVYTVSAVATAALSFVMINIAIDLSPWRKLEIFLVVVGVLVLGASYVGRFREDEGREADEMVSLGLWLGSLLAALPLIVAVFVHWNAEQEFSLYDELALIAVTLLMVATGVVWRVKASTLLGGGTLFLYLCVLIVSLLYRPQVAVGIYLTAGGAVLFALGILLAVYRDHLMALPDRVANREGVFRVIGWR